MQLRRLVRCFENPNIVHVDGEINPISDIGVIDTEMVLADLASIEKAKAEGVKNDEIAKKNEELSFFFAVLEKVENALQEGCAIRNMSLSRDEIEIIQPLFLLTIKADDVRCKCFR